MRIRRKKSSNLKRLSIFFGVLCVFLLVVFTIMHLAKKDEVIQENIVIPQDTTSVEKTPQAQGPFPVVVGTSVQGRDIKALTYGTGEKHLVFVGGIHGGYEWNSTLLAYALIDHFEQHPDAIPQNVSVTIIPSINPDGLFKVIGKEGRFTELDVPENVSPEGLGRFNANNVDLNRNFACKWQPESTWRGNIVNAGTEAFSEPEALALKNFVTQHSPTAVVFWHSKSNAVYASECENGILPETRTIMNTYAKASGYPAIDTFDAYEITGDAEGWLASIGIPAITVELKTHETIEWDRNLGGVTALMTHYAK